MKIIRGSSNITVPIKRPVLTVGNFDGVHLGHQEIFGRVVKSARKTGGTAVVYTFDPHPARRVAPKASPKLLQTFDQKMSAIGACGIDLCVVEPFTLRFSRLTPEDFFAGIILKHIRPRHLVVGHDLTFGRHRMGTVPLLENLCKKNGIRIDIVNAVFLKEMLVSSTQIRNLVSAGNMEAAGKMLGRPFALTGRVVKGLGLGGELGFHTANILPENEMIPPYGVYATRTLGHMSVTNVGCNPTFGGTNLSVETHILNFSGDLYKKRIEVAFCGRLRDEIAFKSPLALKRQIEDDIKKAKRLLKKL